MDTRTIKVSQDTVDAINGELEYISTLSQQDRSDEVHYGTVGQIATLQTYARKALDAWVMNPGNDSTLHELRKCAAIAIRALETEGCPRREGYGR